MCTCIVSLRPICWLLSSWCFFCIRRAAHISANGDANRYGYVHGDGYGYRSLRPSRSVKQHVFLASKVTGYEPGGRNHLHLFYKLYFYFTIFESLRNPNPHDYPLPGNTRINKTKPQHHHRRSHTSLPSLRSLLSLLFIMSTKIFKTDFSMIPFLY